MFRCMLKPASASKLLRGRRLGQSAGCIIVAVSGGLYCHSQQIVHADDDGESTRRGYPKNNDHRQPNGTPPHDPPPHGFVEMNHFSGTIVGTTGVARFDSASVPSTNYRQDDLAVTSVKIPTGTSWTLFGLYDGYAGWQTSTFLGDGLLSAVLGSILDVTLKYEPSTEEHVELDMLPSSPGATLEPYSEAIDRVIKEAFRLVDDTIVHTGVELATSTPSKAAAVGPLAVALAGSSALLSIYDSDTRTLKVALTGDSSAVLGRRIKRTSGQNFYEIHKLTSDQTSANSDENIITHGRSVSRAFGLAAYKLGREIQERLHIEYLGDHPRKVLSNLTAEPEITTIEVRPGDFLIMASKGLWNCLTSAEAVGLVGHFLEYPVDGGVALERDQLPVQLEEEDNTIMYKRWGAEKRFVYMDDNAGVHLVRNALGGADGDLMTALLHLEPPRSQQFRDDITVTVVFFDG